MRNRASEESLARRKEAFGVNEFEYPPPKSFLQLCRDALDDLTVQILCVAAIISLGIGAGLPKHREEYGYLEGIAIVIVVFVVVFLQAYIDYVKEQKFRQLNSIKDNYAVKVVRNGEVRGDRRRGFGGRGRAQRRRQGPRRQRIPRGQQAARRRVRDDRRAHRHRQVPRQGSVPPVRDDNLRGIRPHGGHRRRLVVAVGRHLEDAHRRAELYPLQDRLDVLVVTVGNFGIGAAIATFIASMIRWIIDGSEGKGWDGVLILDYLINSVTIVVVAIPEGLPWPSRSASRSRCAK